MVSARMSGPWTSLLRRGQARRGGSSPRSQGEPSHFSFGTFGDKPGNSPSGLTQPECEHQVCAISHHFRPHRAPAAPSASTMTMTLGAAQEHPEHQPLPQAPEGRLCETGRGQ